MLSKARKTYAEAACKSAAASSCSAKSKATNRLKSP